MTDEPDSRSDEKLTPAEVARELRVNPATVRLWISKGQLPATRVGMRKLMIRRGDLEETLASFERADRAHAETPAEAPPRSPSAATGDAEANAAFENSLQLFGLAMKDLNYALSASSHARPSDGYIERLRAVADGYEYVASTTLDAAAKNPQITWTGVEHMTIDHLPYEMRPGGNRLPNGLWNRFDAAYERHTVTVAGHDMVAIGNGFRELADELFAVAKRLEADAQADAASDAKGRHRNA